LVGSSLACNYWTGVEVTDRGKYSSLLRYGNNYARKMTFSLTILIITTFDNIEREREREKEKEEREKERVGER